MKFHVFDYRVAFFDTDTMGVVHHSNYIRFFELARVDWLRSLGLMKEHIPYGSQVMAVLRADAEFKRPAVFDELISIFVEGRLEGARILFRYAIYSKDKSQWLAQGSTEHVLCTKGDLKPLRPPTSWSSYFSASPFSDAWPPLK